MTPAGDEIEEQFARAVRLALERREAVAPPPGAITEPASTRPHRRRFGQWRVALLYVALTAMVAIIVVVALLE